MLCKHVTAMPFAIVSGALDYLENTRTSTSIDFNFHPLAVIRGPSPESHHSHSTTYLVLIEGIRLVVNDFDD